MTLILMFDLLLVSSGRRPQVQTQWTGCGELCRFLCLVQLKLLLLVSQMKEGKC